MFSVQMGGRQGGGTPVPVSFPDLWSHVLPWRYPSLWSHVLSRGYPSLWYHVLSGGYPQSWPRGVPQSCTPISDWGTPLAKTAVPPPLPQGLVTPRVVCLLRFHGGGLSCISCNYHPRMPNTCGASAVYSECLTLISLLIKDVKSTVDIN